MNHNPDVIVVGGGIGGLSAAYALTRKGLRVRVLEQAPEFGEVGAGIQLAPNCTRILHEYGLLDDVEALAVHPARMVMRDAVDGTELTRLDLVDMESRYGFPYLLIHRSDLHGVLLNACRHLEVDLQTAQQVVRYDRHGDSASVEMVDGRREEAPVVVAADGLHSVARDQFVGDDPVSSSYVAYRAAVPIADVQRQIDLNEVVVYVGAGCHFVHYGLRGGELLNQVAVFRSDKARDGATNWGTPDELDRAFDGTTSAVRAGVPQMWRDRWWRMYDRNPIDTWVFGRVVLLGDAAHPPLQYLAQGAIMAIEDGWVLAEQAARHMTAAGGVDWQATAAAYEAVRTGHCRRVVLAARDWGDFWHAGEAQRESRNALLRARDHDDYTYVDWLYQRTALVPEDEPLPFPTGHLDDGAASATEGVTSSVR
jgi:2-polyprenyl-6-methoxyphenol hydroxylase-like FAD-dependent oxidoreductase